MSEKIKLELLENFQNKIQVLGTGISEALDNAIKSCETTENIYKTYIEAAAKQKNDEGVLAEKLETMKRDLGSKKFLKMFLITEK